jgi:uncharacterized iron-regulated membrane protein
MNLRTILFWPHLIAGTLAGLVILVMATTGTMLMFERELIDWSDRAHRSGPPAAGVPRASLSTVLSSWTTRYPGLQPSTVTIAADANAPVRIAAGARTFYADAYSGVVIGEAGPRTRQWMRHLRSWHRWLGMEGERRPIGRALTGGATVLLAFLVVSGACLWIPRAWTAVQFQAVALFKRGARGKARDFNWHHVIGLWSCVPLFVVAISAWPMSFEWANAGVYRAMGEAAPPRQAAPGLNQARERGRSEDASAPIDAPIVATNGVDHLLARAVSQERDWKTVTLRWPASAVAPVQFAIDRGDGGQPQKRSTLTLTRAGSVVRYETFDTLTAGRRARSILRFAHTGEVLGLPGQVIAGAASAGAAVLAWTGLALTCRRVNAWRARRRRVAVPSHRHLTPPPELRES